MPDEITLTLPREQPFYRVAHLVLGGLAVRLDLTFEHLEDLQLALAGLLERPAGEREVTVRVRVEGDRIRTEIGPFEGHGLRDELGRESDRELTLRRLLDTVVDDVQLAERDGLEWIELTKNVSRESADGG